MIAVPVTPGATLQLGRAHPLFSMAEVYTNRFSPQFDVTPDGQHFIIARQPDATGFGVALVINFLDELRRRMATK